MGKNHQLEKVDTTVHGRNLAPVEVGSLPHYLGDFQAMVINDLLQMG